MPDTSHNEITITDSEIEQLMEDAMRLTGIDPDNMRVSCDPYGVPVSYLQSPIESRLWRA